MNRLSFICRIIVTILAMASAAPVDTGQAAEKADYGLITGSVSKPVEMSVSATYCENIGDAAIEARDAIRAKYLIELESRIEVRMTALEERRAEVERWMKQREEFIDRAQRSLVDIYTAMRPEAAAKQISILDDLTAAAILVKLKPRTASAILNEIKPIRAARLAGVIAGSAKVEKAKNES